MAKSIHNFGLITLVVGSLAFPASAETLLLQNAAVHTVSGKTLSPGHVLINGTKIEAVLEGDASQPKTDKILDLKGLHLFPGMIALDTTLGLTEISGVRATRDNEEVGEYTPDVESWVAVNPDSELMAVARANGVTHFEPAPQGGIVAGQSALMALDGWTYEQMAVKKPIGLHVYWPDMDLNTTPKEKFKDQSKWKSLEDQAKERQKKLKAIDDFFADAKAYATAKKAAAKDGAPIPEPTPAWEAMLLPITGRVPLMIHADEIRQIKSAVAWAETNELRIVLVGARDAWMMADELAAKKISVLYEHTYTQPPRDSSSYDVQYAAPEKMRKAGVKFAIGMGATTFDAALIKNLPYQASQPVAFGLPADEALKSITLYPAIMAGVGDRLGSIEVGKEASLFAADADILDIRAHVKHVWIAGKEVSLENRHTRLYEKYRNRPKAK